MKRLPWLLLGMALVFMLGVGASSVLTRRSTPHCPWKEIGTITAVQAYPAVGERDYNDVTVDIPDANCVLWLNVPETATYLNLRFQATADADTATVAILVAADDYLADSSIYDDFALAGSLALTCGTQVGSHSNFYVDTIAPTDGILAWSAMDSATNRICVAETNLKGYKRVAIIATVWNTTTLYVQARWR